MVWGLGLALGFRVYGFRVPPPNPETGNPTLVPQATCGIYERTVNSERVVKRAFATQDTPGELKQT